MTTLKIPVFPPSEEELGIEPEGLGPRGLSGPAGGSENFGACERSERRLRERCCASEASADEL